jgi:hypothetical protein
MICTMSDDTANIVLHAYDGTRQLVSKNFRWRAQTRDGRGSEAEGQKTLEFLNLTGPSHILNVPAFDNFADLYTVLAFADGHENSAWYPVHVNDALPVDLYLMLMPKDGAPHFAGATWSKLVQARPGFADIIRRGCADADDAAAKYGMVQEKRPLPLACLLNLMTSLSSMRLPSGKSALDYYWNIAWPPGDPDDNWLARLDQVLHQDRLFCYVDRAILDDVRKADGHGFAKELNPQAWGHTGATESYKQTQFDMANVQLSFHGFDTPTLTDDKGNQIPCIKIEPDIDYYKDIAAHALIEVVPNFIDKRLTDPRVVYWMRWMTAKQDGLPDFDPLYTVESQAASATA